MAAPTTILFVDIPKGLKRVLLGIPKGRAAEAAEGALRAGFKLILEGAKVVLRRRPYSEGQSPMRNRGFPRRKKLWRGLSVRSKRYKKTGNVTAALGFVVKDIAKNYRHAVLAEEGVSQTRRIVAGTFRGGQSPNTPSGRPPLMLAGPRRFKARRPRSSRNAILLGTAVTHRGSNPVHYMLNTHLRRQNAVKSTIFRELRKRTKIALKRYAQDQFRSQVRKSLRGKIPKGTKLSITNVSIG